MYTPDRLSWPLASRHKTNKATEILVETIKKLDLIDIFRTLKKSGYIFSSAHGTFSRSDHILGHKANLTKFRSVENISSIFTDHIGMKLDIDHRKRNEKKPTTWT